MRYPSLVPAWLTAAAVAASVLGHGMAAAAGPEPSNLVLENASCRVEVDRQHGRLLRLKDKQGGIDLASPLEGAENFRLLVSLPDDPRNCVYGKDQPLSRTETAADALVLHWDGPMKDQRGNAHDLAATMRIQLDGDAVAFSFKLANRTKYKVMEVWYPAIGGLLAFGPPESAADAHLDPPPHGWKHFRRPFGHHLAAYPTQNLGFVNIDNPTLNRGLYLGAHDPVARFKAFNFLEEKQGDRSNVAVWLIHYPFVPPGADFEGSPLVAQFHNGNWIAAGKQIYRPWFIKTFGLMKPEDDWIRRQGFFQMIMIMLPEGNVNYTIRQIPQLARDGLKYGLTSLQIAGWQFGGHDNGYPYYEPDPRLGTWDDIKDAMRQCHEMGVKVYFFANIQVANLDTEWYKATLKDETFETAQGAPAWIDGWGMGTLASRMKLTTPLMTFNDSSFPDFADAQLKYFKKLAEVGVDGIHIDKIYPQAFNFNPRIVLSPDQSPWEGTVRLVERISRECRAIHPDFRLSFECTWDRLLSYGASTWWAQAGNMALARKVFPELVETVGLYQPYDYLGANDAVREGFAVMVAPYQFNRSMGVEPWRGLAAYIRDVKKIQDELADFVFVGEQLDPTEATLSTDPPQNPAVQRAAYCNLKNSKRACIVTNRGSSPAAISFEGFVNRTGKVRIYSPAKPVVSSELPARFTIDPERIAFVVEE